MAEASPRQIRWPPRRFFLCRPTTRLQEQGLILSPSCLLQAPFALNGSSREYDTLTNILRRCEEPLPLSGVWGKNVTPQRPDTETDSLIWTPPADDVTVVRACGHMMTFA
eukprot:768247-Hanusia_phi.AAC.1